MARAGAANGRLLAVLLAGVLAAAAPAQAGGDLLRCGWFENPTPGNAWLTDRDGAWLVGIQGGSQADGDWPRFEPDRWVRTNGSYGYGCACLRVETDAATRQVTRILESSSRPLAVCRRDRALKEPERP